MTLTKAQTIPAWYSNDWAPAQGPGELPQTSWDAIEIVIDDLLKSTPRQSMTRALFRTLWLESTRMAPMEHLQQLLITASMALDPGRPKGPILDVTPIRERATGPMPRWSYTDVEVALTYTWQALPLTIAIQRHHELLRHRGERMSALDTTRQLLLLVSGLPCPAMAKPPTSSKALGYETRQEAA